MKPSSISSLWLAGAMMPLAATAVDIDWTSESSIKAGAKTIAYGLMKYYTGNNTGDVPGNLPDPYYWWEAGAMFGTMIDYWAYTGDTDYVNETFIAMQHQVGDDNDFMPTNQTKSEGNDDQGFWALAAMAAAETNFLNPNDTSAGGVQYLALAQAVFNEYATRWDTADCGGGLRWQIWTFNNGYTYKNSIANGCFFNIGARLARYTGNDTYADWAETIWDWMETVGFIDDSYNIFDGAGFGTDAGNCTDIDKTQWTYNAGIWLHGAAAMYNITNGTAQTKWKTRLDGILARTQTYFFQDDIMYEPACEPQGTCTTDSLSFKAYLVRWLAGTAQLASYTWDTISALLATSAKNAALQCDGTATEADGYKGLAGTACGLKWTENSTWDGTNGVGQQMAALSAVFYSQVMAWSPALYSDDTGGTSTGDASAGAEKSESSLTTLAAITTGDRAGAAFLTMATVGGLLAGCFFMVKD
ncbi:family 76 glycoside hydrolase [Cryphonectria parasitica EP155]|uniref:Mannan endo-1,6-alpha-mannosidase n=1 Tax=Cryphonectria parasitica (strain ATCC 38755 / EP155) TaxID=660469 RepID=A0A9P5CPJ1_CRYP1|nr:family 76 glycoside hydrolase [Cryphonectria parasitica EP155]KAF3766203.1 family 76 glycoside hydrolase [Cryphonectria parasitica EP155]